MQCRGKGRWVRFDRQGKRRLRGGCKMWKRKINGLRTEKTQFWSKLLPLSLGLEMVPDGEFGR